MRGPVTVVVYLRLSLRSGPYEFPAALHPATTSNGARRCHVGLIGPSELRPQRDVTSHPVRSSPEEETAKFGAQAPFRHGQAPNAYRPCPRPHPSPSRTADPGCLYDRWGLLKGGSERVPLLGHQRNRVDGASDLDSVAGRDGLVDGQERVEHVISECA
jgi:hypothetical protein